MDLQKHGWRGKKTASSVMTIAEIHQQAAREQAQKTAAAAQSTRESMSRGGSRAGRQRDGHDWQTPQQPVRLPQRPADMSNLGKITTSGAAPTFAGPSSVFSKRGKAGAAATPPLSRQASTANMFSALNDAESAAAEPTPERKKLNLKPRSVPMPGEEKDGEDGEDAEEEEEGEVAEDEVEEEKAPAVMSEEAAKIKIASDMKELWGEKDMGGSRNPEDIAEYFKALPEERQSLLSIQLIDDAFRLSKYKDAEVIAKGLKFALEQQVATSDVLQKG
jgi:translation initiation factor 4G